MGDQIDGGGPRPGRSITAFTVVVVLSFVLVGTGCLPSTRSAYEGRRGGDRAILLGHSIPTSARPELAKQMGRVRRVAFDTEDGRTITQASDSIDWAVAEGVGVVVVALAENELGLGLSQGALRSRVRATLSRLASIPCVVWIDVAEDANAMYRSDWRSEAQAFNDWLPSEAARHGNAHVAGWADWSRSHDGWFLPDRLHLRRAGRAAYAAFVATEVDRSCGGGAATTPGGAMPDGAR